VDKTLRVRTKDLIFHLHEDAEDFMRKVVMSFSMDREQLNFQEFVYAVWSFCTLRTKQRSYGKSERYFDVVISHSDCLLDQFVFELYDDAKCGAISALKAQSILEEIHLSGLKRDPVASRYATCADDAYSTLCYFIPGK
jgi:hypothetical protein